MSWGKGIALTLAVFMFGIGVLVYKSTQQKFNLVTPNYYEESLIYDQMQIKKSNYSKLDAKTKTQIDYDNGHLGIMLPDYFENKEIDGVLVLYNPTDKALDKTYALKHQISQVPLADLKTGYWKIKADWKTGDKEYFFEDGIYIN